MLELQVVLSESYDPKTDEFIYEEVTLQLEHSLVSLHKWESKWCKPYLTDKPKTYDETIDYIKCMTLTPNVNPEVYKKLSKQNIDQIQNYISAPMSAVYMSKNAKTGGHRGRQVTAELIYCWMFTLNIPAEFQNWHLNSLMALIRVCSNENTPPTKRNRREVASEYARLNAERRKQLNSKG